MYVTDVSGNSSHDDEDVNQVAGVKATTLGKRKRTQSSSEAVGIAKSSSGRKPAAKKSKVAIMKERIVKKKTHVDSINDFANNFCPMRYGKRWDLSIDDKNKGKAIPTENIQDYLSKQKLLVLLCCQC